VNGKKIKTIENGERLEKNRVCLTANKTTKEKCNKFKLQAAIPRGWKNTFED